MRKEIGVSGRSLEVNVALETFITFSLKLFSTGRSINLLI